MSSLIRVLSKWYLKVEGWSEECRLSSLSYKLIHTDTDWIFGYSPTPKKGGTVIWWMVESCELWLSWEEDTPTSGLYQLHITTDPLSLVIGMASLLSSFKFILFDWQNWNWNDVRISTHYYYHLLSITSLHVMLIWFHHKLIWLNWNWNANSNTHVW